jgi:hypothetical protein
VLEVHAIEKPIDERWIGARVDSVSCCDAPIIMVVEGGLTVMLAIGTRVTVIVELPDFPSLTAVIFAVPTPTPVTSPVVSTVAAALFEDHVTMRPVRIVPLESLTTALSCCVFPTTTLAVAGLTNTVATGAAVTVIEEVPV